MQQKIWLHIKKTACGDDLNREEFQKKLNKHQHRIRQAKHQSRKMAEDPEAEREKTATKVAKAKAKKMAEDPEAERKKTATKEVLRYHFFPRSNSFRMILAILSSS